MRRALLIVTAAGLTVSAAAPEAAPTATAFSSRPAVKIVEYAGYRFEVPVDWPVYRLDHDRSRCVRFDVHAVYLGRPGPDQDCPAHLRGRTSAVLVQPLPGPAGGRPGVERLAGASSQVAIPRSGARAVAHEVQLMLDRAGMLVTATYDSDPGTIARILRSGRVTSRHPATAGAQGPGSAAPRRDGHPGRQETGPRPGTRDGGPPGTGRRTTRLAAADPDPDSWPPVAEPPTAATTPTFPPARLPTPVFVPSEFASSGGPSSAASAPWGPPANPYVLAAALRSGRVTGPAFDTCTAPSLRAMRAWRHAFVAANIYIGGASRACANTNLTAAWVQTVRQMGWRLIPTYVGLQAPCNRFPDEIDPDRAQQQGWESALDAVAQARALGLPEGAPIYFDMEAYSIHDAVCRDVVLTFLDAWTQMLHYQGYVSGVYSSVRSGIRDLVEAVGINEPDAVWFAHWDRDPNVYHDSYLTDDRWWRRRRIKQYRGAHNERHGGVKLNIDSDHVDGYVY